MTESRREQLVAEIGQRRISAIVRAEDAQLASDAMQAVVEGGFRMVEFTLTTPDSYRLIGEFAENPDLLVGAGTVLTPEQAREAVSAGARFLVSPVSDKDVIAEARRLDVPSIPGAFTPREMLEAERWGADLIKIFPSPGNIAQFVGQIRGPLPNLKLFPTAGVDPENFTEILKAGAFGVGFVSSLFRPEELRSGDMGSIRERARRIVERLATFGS